MAQTKTTHSSFPRLSWWQIFLLGVLVTIIIVFQHSIIQVGWYSAVFDPNNTLSFRVYMASGAIFANLGWLMMARDIIWGRK